VHADQPRDDGATHKIENLGIGGDRGRTCRTDRDNLLPVVNDDRVIFGGRGACAVDHAHVP
jgi:hypothetical protein